jgi:acyl-CoA reductase-like NAD-dependent aldehyde dehydrogenase/nicotinamidase-related amidase
MKPALLLVDLQNDYLRAERLEPAAGEIAARAAALLDLWRSAGAPVFHVWTTISREADRRMPHWVSAERWICVEGTEGHATPEALRPRGAEPVVRKTFFSGFGTGELERLLRAAGCDAVVIAGVHEHGCVRATALDAYQAGFAVWIAEDAIGSDDPLHAAVTRRYLGARAIRYAPVEAIARSLRPASMPPASRRVARLASWIGGREAPGGRDTPLVHASPVSGEPVWEMSEAGPEEVARAARDAARAQASWESAPLAARVAVIERFAALLGEQGEAVAVQMASEIGKPIAQGRAELARTGALVRAALQRAEEPLEVPCGKHSQARYRPLGTLAFVAPWNNPAAIPAGKIVPALLFGNSVVMKPAPAGSAVALWLARCLQQAGLPDGVLNVVLGGRTTAEALMAEPAVDAVTITGSIAAGYAAAEVCARRCIPLQAELGGNNASIVWADCDLDSAAALVAEGAFGFAGQRCTANRRAIVHEDCCDAFLDALAGRVRALGWGDPREVSTQVGPLVSAAARARVASLLARAVPAASRMAAPHLEVAASRDTPRGDAFLAPTIVCCDDPSAEIVQHESFGPVLVVQRARDFEEALALCNGVPQGLVASLFSRSEPLREAFLRRARAGILKLDRSTVDADAEAPFGGWKASGIGPAEHGPSNRESYTRVQSVYR